MSEASGVRTLGRIFAESAQTLRAAGLATPDLDARLLLAEAEGIAPAGVHGFSRDPVSEPGCARLAQFLDRRLSGEPVHRIIGRRAFYEHEFLLSPETLEPRPDTETLVEAARTFMADRLARQKTLHFADLGTGTGAIAISLLALFPAARALAVDISQGALATALRNAEAAGVADRMLATVGDFLAAIGGPLDLIVSNPPYIRSEDIGSLAREVREHDPLLALDGGHDGLSAYRSIAASARSVLAHDGAILVEIGAGQEDDVSAVFSDRGLRPIAGHRDLSGLVRVLGFAAQRDEKSVQGASSSHNRSETSLFGESACDGKISPLGS
ncbi:peptide chain release factor N(5)-glutamine methyltransferase [Aurantimonas sp. VKM B-3413]|uniref:peptide chain release factor N(5)-glutamine methyltransferase n=1 Tax=Aurantimonas sp. VKM B-3413 TaxID=2779401 RepID=UPI001E2A34BA|nr:peptide chain release factor N(5)-glutamine methyltransferase [Aurantimonas sp. VKM B-3413]MCB8840008.1 peptide chain release factor N(5)-glutamine methyltransferase [Aurantimonas sp. VKM B-3413]